MLETLQESKAIPTPSLKQMVEILTRENECLREELTYRQKLQELREELQQEVDYVTNRLKIAIITFRRS